MLAIGTRLGLIASVFIGTPLLAQATVSQGRSVPAHQVPIPTTVSPAFGQSIGVPDRVWPQPLPKTNGGWKAIENPDPKVTDARISALLVKLDLTLVERRFGGVSTFEITPRNMRVQDKSRVLVHVHGGGYVLGAGKSGITEAILVAGASGIKTISIDYRMPPDFPFPAPMDDIANAWRAICSAYPGHKIGLFGTSTGGAMVLALVQRAQAEKIPLPAAIISGTPWSDLTETGDSYFTNKYLDPMGYDALLRPAALQYAQGMNLKDPRLSPVYGSFEGFPPTLLLSGTRDLFLSNTIRVDRKLRDAGARSELIVYEGQSHGLYLSGLEYAETHTALKDIADFWDRHL